MFGCPSTIVLGRSPVRSGRRMLSFFIKLPSSEKYEDQEVTACHYSCLEYLFSV